MILKSFKNHQKILNKFSQKSNVRYRLKRQSYPSIDNMWFNQLNIKPNTNTFPTHPKTRIIDPIGSIKNWYNRAKTFWTSSQSTYNGVMNGYGNLSQLDISGSLNFLKLCIHDKIGTSFNTNRVLDCGAGVGRVAKQMLCSIFNTVDVVDQCQKFIQKSKQILKNQKIGHFYIKGLQQFQFQQKYDCIWIQWVLSHLTDQDAIKFLKKAKQNITKQGFIIVKDNYNIDGFLLDKNDCSVTRTLDMYKKLFQSANLHIAKSQQQSWPSDLLNVKMFLLV